MKQIIYDKYFYIYKYKSIFPINFMCKISKITQASYYRWLKRNKPEYVVKFDENIAKLILDIFTSNNSIYGVPRIKIAINNFYKINISQKKVYRYMCLLNIKSFVRKKRNFRKPKEIKVLNRKFDNIVKRMWDNYDKGELASTDVSYLPYSNKTKFFYLSILKDIKTGFILGHVVSERNDNKIYIDTLKNEIFRDFNKKLIIHSDNGFQYTSIKTQEYLIKNNIIISLSRLGNSINNSQSETFFASLKIEWLIGKNFKIFNEIKNSVDDIEYYNFKRIRIKTEFTPWEAWNLN